jgi:Zn-dependent oligopeptidase
MERSSGRGGYQTCAGYVNKILQLGGLAQARQIVQDWRAQYPRRPAMLEELRGFRF